jgi:endonuclease I
LLGRFVVSEYAEGLGQAALLAGDADSIEAGTLSRHRFFSTGTLLVVAALVRVAAADVYDPPEDYYDAATSTGGILKSQLHGIIDDHTVLPYNDSSSPYLDTRTALQITDDATPNNPNDHVIRLVYNGVLLDVSGLNGPPPGWNNGGSWDREHTWPRSRGIDESGPDNTDLHHLMPSTPSVNSTRGNRNFGGAFGQPFGVVDDAGPGMWYPGDADAGRIARAQFYMDVRYDGGDGSTSDLELITGNPSDDGTELGSLSRIVEWHFAAPPTEFERRRNHVVDTQFQHNRNPFIDRPELMWSVFVDQANDSRITVSGGTTDANGGSVRNIDYGRVFKNSALPTTSTAITLDKTGTDGTYFEVTASGQATSTLGGRYNAFRTNTTDSKNLTVGLAANTATVGLRTGSVSINNLDITTGGGAGRGANDANDTINMMLTVLDHATPSFASDSTIAMLSHDFGTITTASIGAVLPLPVYNRGVVPEFTASMDFDSVFSSGDTSILLLNGAEGAGLIDIAGGSSFNFSGQIAPTAVGTFAATYTLRFSDEDILGAENNKDLTLSLTGTVVLAGDFNRDGSVDSADYIVWKKSNGTSTANFAGADADGSGFVDGADLDWWQQNFGLVATPGGGGSSYVPEPAGVVIGVTAMIGLLVARRRDWRPVGVAAS